jgi:hypothetical protein
VKLVLQRLRRCHGQAIAVHCCFAPVLELEPYERKDGNLLYVYPPLERNQEITLRMHGGKLAAIHWSFYMD